MMGLQNKTDLVTGIENDLAKKKRDRQMKAFDQKLTDLADQIDSINYTEAQRDWYSACSRCKKP